MESKQILLLENTVITPDHTLASRTDAACWHCCHGFEGQPYVVPTAKHTNGSWSCVGIFCQVECAKAWLTESREFDKPKNHMLLGMFMRSVFGYDQYTIQCAPSRYVLEKFKGDGTGLSIEEFRSISKRDISYTLIAPEINVNTPHLESTNVIITIGESNKAIAPITSTTHEKESSPTTNPKQGLYHQYYASKQQENKPTTRSQSNKKKEKKRTGTNNGTGLAHLLKKKKRKKKGSDKTV